jgi:hypothetical protein
MSVSRAYQEATDFHRKRPSMKQVEKAEEK